MTDMDKTHSTHPSTRKYLMVASALVIITALEVGIFYIVSLGKAIIPILFILSAVKFGLVGMFYMHLRYDSRLFYLFYYRSFPSFISFSCINGFVWIF